MSPIKRKTGETQSFDSTQPKIIGATAAATRGHTIANSSERVVTIMSDEESKNVSIVGQEDAENK